MLRAGRRDQELERALVVKDRVIEQPADRFLRAVRETDLGLGADLEAVPEAAGLVGQKAAAVGKAHLKAGMAFEHAAEHQARARDRGLERQADEILEIVGSEP